MKEQYMSKLTDSRIRKTVANLLKTKGYSVEDTSVGSGIPKLSRLLIQEGGDLLNCAVKTSTKKGRISFTRKNDGTFEVLSDVDRVVCVHYKTDEEIDVMMFNSQVVERAFIKNWETLKEDGNEHLPIWVNPKPDESRRVTGSGFMNEAIWLETIPLLQEGAQEATANTAISSDEPKSEGIMDIVKNMLSEHMGVRPDQLEIDVRISL